MKFPIFSFPKLLSPIIEQLCRKKCDNQENSGKNVAYNPFIGIMGGHKRLCRNMANNHSFREQKL